MPDPSIGSFKINNELSAQRPTISGVTVPFAEMEPRTGGSPMINVDCLGGGTKIPRVFKVKWSDLTLFIRQVGGFSYISGSKLRRYLPLFDPLYQWLPATKIGPAQGMNWNGLKNVISTNPAQSFLQYDNGIVPVEFNEVDYPITDDATVDADTDQGEFGRFNTFTTDSSVDYLSIPAVNNILQFSEGPHQGQTVNDSPGRPLPGETFHYRWRMIPYNNAPYATISDYLGRVNKTTFAGCAPHTLLFIAKEQELKKQVDGSWALDLIYSFRYLRTAWNDVLDWGSLPFAFQQVAANGVFQTPGLASDGTLIFDEREMRNLWKVNT